MLQDQLDLCDAVHDWHLYVSEYALVANITACLAHVCEVHFDCNPPIDRFVTLDSKKLLDLFLQRNQVEKAVVDKKYLGFAVTVTFIPNFVLF